MGKIRSFLANIAKYGRILLYIIVKNITTGTFVQLSEIC